MTKPTQFDSWLLDFLTYEFLAQFQCIDLKKNLFSRGEISSFVAGFFGGPRVRLRETKDHPQKIMFCERNIRLGGYKKAIISWWATIGVGWVIEDGCVQLCTHQQIIKFFQW